MMMLGFWTMSIVFACQGGALSSKEMLQAVELQRSLINGSAVSPESKIVALRLLQNTADSVRAHGIKEERKQAVLKKKLEKDQQAIQTPRQKPGKKLVFVD